MNFDANDLYWTVLERITPVFNFDYFLTFLESEIAPISYAFLYFAVNFESLDELDIQIGVIDGCKKAKVPVQHHKV